MKIAMLTNNYKPFVGGVPISVERQAEELAKRGHEVTVFAPEYGGDDMQEGGRIRVVRFGTRKKCMENGMVYPRLILREINEIFAREHFDVIHTHHPVFVGTMALYLGRRYQIPVVYTYHTRYEDYLHYVELLREEKSFPAVRRGLMRLARERVVPGYMRWFTNQCDMILAPTAGMLRRIRANGTQAPMAVLPTGLKEAFYREYPEEAAAIRRQYLPEGGVLFCTTGRLEEEKNPHFLLQGIARLKEKMTETFRVLFLGDGSLREDLIQEAKAYGIGDCVEFLGNVSNERVNRYLQAADLFLFASRSETQGIVLAEAFAAGCPIVAVDGSGVEDMVVNGENGYRTEEDIEVWSDRVLQALSLRTQMEREARKTAEGYRAAGLAAHAEALYSQCITRQKGTVRDLHSFGAKSMENIFEENQGFGRK